ncbi:hypothetical protein RB195_000720 [Necator americanus]|uniref:Uncharacterized protein n=1 Tax=Necator americanus TaxID=51031 RepID=A0ABR1DB18_NECAM
MLNALKGDCQRDGAIDQLRAQLVMAQGLYQRHSRKVQEGHVGQRLCMESFMRRLGPESDIMSNVRFDRLSPFAVLSYVWEVASDSENSECRSYQSCLFAYVARGRNSAVRHPVTFTPLRGGKPLWRGLE